MKRSILILLVALLTLTVNAQKEEVIASAGGYDETSTISLSWTLGETIVPAYVTDELMLTPSLQPTLFVTAVEETIIDLIEVSVYPNPASEFVKVAFAEPLDTEADVFLLDLQGKLIYRGVLEVGTIEKVLDLQGYAQGVYLMRIVKGKLTNTYRVVKQ